MQGIFITHFRIDSCQVLKLIVFAFSDNLSADFFCYLRIPGIHGIQLLECMMQGLVSESLSLTYAAH